MKPALSIILFTTSAGASSSSGAALTTSTFSAQRSSRNAAKVSWRWLSSFGFAMPIITARMYAMRGDVSLTSRVR